jgi:hypothetical protein
VKFARPEYEGQLLECHPQLRDVLAAFEVWSYRESLPEPVITDCWRTRDELQSIYVARYTKLIHALKAGQRLSPGDRDLAVQMSECTGEEIAKRARGRFSWHLVRCAVDIRSRHYDLPQLLRVQKWFETRCEQPLWEYLTHDVSGPHIHLGRRDFSWRTQYDRPSPRNP